jgi:hypothetical protein
MATATSSAGPMAVCPSDCMMRAACDARAGNVTRAERADEWLSAPESLSVCQKCRMKVKVKVKVKEAPP